LAVDVTAFERHPLLGPQAGGGGEPPSGAYMAGISAASASISS
jgi:hypothetical protein